MSCKGIEKKFNATTNKNKKCKKSTKLQFYSVNIHQFRTKTGIIAYNYTQTEYYL